MLWTEQCKSKYKIIQKNWNTSDLCLYFNQKSQNQVFIHHTGVYHFLKNQNSLSLSPIISNIRFRLLDLKEPMGLDRESPPRISEDPGDGTVAIKSVLIRIFHETRL